MKRNPEAYLSIVLLGFLLLFALLSLFEESRGYTQSIFVAMDAQEAAALAAREGVPLDDFWERAKTIGVRGAVLRNRPFGSLIDAGQVLYFSRAEAEKWLLAGLVAPQAIKPNSLWIRDADLAAAAQRSLERKVKVASQPMGTVTALQLPESFDPTPLSAGFDPAQVKLLKRLGLFPVLDTSDADDIASFPNDNAGGVIALLRPGSAGRLKEPFHGWLILPVDAKGRSSFIAWADRMVLGERLSALAPSTALFSAVLGQGVKALLIEPSGAHGVEPNFGGLRRLCGELRRAGFAFGIPDLPVGETGQTPWQARMRYAIALALALVAPLLAVRHGLSILRSARVAGRWPQASPVPEIVLALAAALATATALGIVVYAFLSMADWRLGLLPYRWSIWVTLIPLCVSALTLYSFPAKPLRRAVRRPITLIGAARFLLVAAAIGLVFCPMRLPISIAPLWWLSFRWKEILIGVPCLTVAFWRQWHHLEALTGKDKPSGADPRPWLLAGLLAAIGVIRIFGLARAPYAELLAQTAVGWTLGAALGAAVIAFTAVW